MWEKLVSKIVVLGLIVLGAVLLLYSTWVYLDSPCMSAKECMLVLILDVFIVYCFQTIPMAYLVMRGY